MINKYTKSDVYNNVINKGSDMLLNIPDIQKPSDVSRQTWNHMQKIARKKRRILGRKTRKTMRQNNGE